MPGDTTTGNQLTGPFTVADVASRYAVTSATVIGWIRAGELLAVNVSRSARSKKPRWRITPAALEAFEAGRMASPQIAPGVIRWRRKREGYTPVFYT
jgi:hypothetical protein